MQKFNSGGVSIAFESWGDGPPVLLVHGFASSARVNWADTGWVNALTAAGYRVIAFDNRGHGESEKLYDRDLYLATMMAEDALRLLDHLELPKIAVMGYSMGARISAFLTMQHPGRVACAVFAGLASRMITGVGGTEAIAEALLAESPAQTVDREARAFRLFADSTRSDRQALAACILSSRVKIKAEALAGIGCPVLVIAGELDDIAGSVPDLVKIMPKAEGIVIPRRNHMNSVGNSFYKSSVLAFLSKHRDLW